MKVKVIIEADNGQERVIEGNGVICLVRTSSGITSASIGEMSLDFGAKAIRCIERVIPQAADAYEIETRMAKLKSGIEEELKASPLPGLMDKILGAMLGEEW